MTGIDHSDHSEISDADLSALQKALRESRKIVVFSGAGISTQSGIPDFRGPRGIWSKMKPIEFADFVADEAVRQESWQRKFENHSVLEQAEPNKAHIAIVRLLEAGQVLAVITQNVDNLHQKSGIPAEKIIELHGNASYATCLSCTRRYELEELEKQFTELGSILPCTDCQGIIKTATISFGQSMPEDAMRRARQATLEADLFLVLGTSLAVYPAAGFPEVAKLNGSRLVIVNQEPTPLDGISDLSINGEVGAVMSAATRYLNC